MPKQTWLADMVTPGFPLGVVWHNGIDDTFNLRAEVIGKDRAVTVRMTREQAQTAVKLLTSLLERTQ